MNRATTDGIVVTRTPLRVSFAGGGTDLAEFYRHGEGAVLSTAIRKYVYVTLKRHGDLFGESIRVNYSETETVTRIDDLRNAIARECLKFLDVEPPIYISTVADLPANTGLGSSGAFAVGLLNALHVWRGDRTSAGQVAEEAAQIEIGILKHPVGKQDQYASAFGGCSLLRFLPTGGVSVEPQQFAPGTRESLFEHLLLFYTGRSRSAGSILGEQQANTPLKLRELGSMRDHAIELQGLLQRGFDADQVGRLLDETWQVKRGLASGVSDSATDAMYATATSAGALGGKLCGAGGGGFLMLVVRPAEQAAVRAALRGFAEVALEYEPTGSRVLLPHMS